MGKLKELFNKFSLDEIDNWMIIVSYYGTLKKSATKIKNQNLRGLLKFFKKHTIFFVYKVDTKKLVTYHSRQIEYYLGVRKNAD